MNQIVQTPKQHFYLAKFLGYNYSIHYKSGSRTKVVNALSRALEVVETQFMMLSIPQFKRK